LQEELEHFPLASLQHIQSVLDTCNYNSICALVVKDTDQKTPDIHLFQCSTVPVSISFNVLMLQVRDLKN